MRARPLHPSTVAAVAVLAALAATAPAADAVSLTGTWTMHVEFSLPDDGGVCTFEGVCTMTQDGNVLSGTESVDLVSGPAACPAQITGDITGTVDGDQLAGQISSQLGVATFTGKPTGSYEGDVTVETGPFAGSDGTWHAELVLLSIPTLSQLGLAALVLLLVATAALALRRRRARAT